MPTGPTFLSNPNLRLILFGGKGGTGKTTSAAATAVRLARARPDRGVLLVSTDPAHSLADSLDQPVGGQVAPVEGVGNLFALALDAAAVLKAFSAQYGAVIKTIAARGTFFDQEDIAGFFDLSLPGLDEVMAIIKIMDLTREGHYDLVILDTAPAGHTLRLLALPSHMEQWIHVLDLMMEKHRFMVKTFRRRYVPDEADRCLQSLAGDLKRLQDLLHNADTTEFVPVVNPEAMSVTETDALIEALNAGAIPVRAVIVNRLSESQDCPFCQARLQDQAPCRREIEHRFAAYQRVAVPLFPGEIRGLAGLEAFAAQLFDAAPPALPDVTPAAGPALPVAGAPPLAALADRLDPNLRLILFGGKGGVGKTTLATATAMEMARREPGKKTLLISTDPAGSLAGSLGCPVGSVPAPVPGADGLYAMQIDAEGQLEELKQRYIREIQAVFGRFLGGGRMDVAFDREVMEELITLIPPGLDEIIALISLTTLLEEGVYQRFILDTAPTGHLLRFLELPQLAIDWFRAFFRMLLKYQGVVSLTDTATLMLELSRGVKKVRAYLTDARSCEFVAVTIPEAMSILETQRLLDGLDRLMVACRRVAVNMLVPPTTCPFCQVRRDQQQAALRDVRAQFARYEVVEFPLTRR